MTLLQDFVQLVATHTGLSIRERDQAAFGNKISERIKKHRGSEWEYYRLLQHHAPESAREWSALASLLTTGESYFFRDREQFALLRNSILPELVKRSKRRRLRIWCAGCSSGEEPYSIAILLKDLLPLRDDRPVLILGTDINDKALEQARKGIYSEWSFRQTDPGLRRRFFSKRDDCWEIDEDIRAMVTFGRCNLVMDTFPDSSRDLHEMDLILCRNVFIYFRPEAVGQVAGKFADTLKDGGYLLTGHGELHLQSLNRLKTRMFNEQVILEKVSETGPDPGTGAPPEKGLPPGKPAAAGGPASSKSGPRPGAAKVAARRSPARRTRPDATQNDLEARLELARSRADRGDYDDAARICREAIEHETTSPLPYFLLAQISEAAGDAGSAKEFLKKTIYLDPSHVAAHMELGALYLGEANERLAAKTIMSARTLLKDSPPGSFIPPYRATTAEELLRHADNLLAGLKEKEGSRGNRS